VFIQVSKYYLTCETSTESTNKLRQTKKPLLFTGNDWGLSLSCWFETPNYNYSTSVSRDGSKARRVHRLVSELDSLSRPTTELWWWLQARPTGHVRQCSRYYSMTSPRWTCTRIHSVRTLWSTFPYLEIYPACMIWNVMIKSGSMPYHGIKVVSRHGGWTPSHRH
jgi:hypothetical protein